MIEVADCSCPRLIYEQVVFIPRPCVPSCAVHSMQYRSRRACVLAEPGSYLKGSNVTISIELPRPVVATNFISFSKVIASSPITYLLDSGNSTGTTSSSRDLIEQYLSRLNSTDALVSSLPPLKSATPEPGSSSYIANFFKDVCASSSGSKPHPNSHFLDDRNRTTDSCLWVLTCTVAAYWERSKHEPIGSDGLRQVRTAPLSAAGFEIPRNTHPITIAWDSISSLNSSRFSNMIFSSTT
jgi:hypothetical protein